MAQQYGGYNQIGYGANPYDQRDDNPAAGQAGRFNNYSQGRYDDGMLGHCPLPAID